MKKLHYKHIIPGFLYSIEIYDNETNKYITDIRLCIENLDETKGKMKVYSYCLNKFFEANIFAIKEGIEKGSLKNLNDEKYSNEGEKEYKKLSKDKTLIQVGQSLKRLLNAK